MTELKAEFESVHGAEDFARLYEQARAEVVELRERLTRLRRVEAENEQLLARLRQARRMEAVGTLARGIAHDFNNILTPVIMGAQMVIEALPDNHPAGKLAARIVTAGERAQDLVNQILAFSQQDDSDPKPLSLAPIVKETMKLVRASLPPGIEVRYRTRDDDALVLANPAQVRQLLMNLITNAVRAMNGTGGLLDVDVREVAPEDADGAAGRAPSARRFVRLCVRDTGCGIEPHVLARILDPSSTSGERDGEPSLGLSTVLGIVRDWNGEIKVDSLVGSGTTVTVFVPALPRPGGAGREPGASPPRGTERILLVDDEVEIVHMAALLLESLGYRVVPHASPAEALAAFVSAPDAFDLVITDMTMPNLNGDGLAREIRRIRRDVPIILLSGHGDRSDVANVEAGLVNAFVAKPVGRDLATQIRAVLTGHRTVL